MALLSSQLISRHFPSCRRESGADGEYSEGSEAPPRFFEQLCGRFKISEEQQEVFQEFSRAMRQCSLAFFLVSASNVILTISQVHPI